MNMRTVTFEVDTSLLFDTIKRLNGDMSAIGNRVVGAMLAEPDFVDVLGMACYGVHLLPYSGPLAVETKQPERMDYEIGDDGVMTATRDWVRDDEATAMRLLACHSIDAPMEVVSTWSDEQVKQADIWAWSSYFSASDNDDIKVPARPDFIPEAKSWADRHPITGEPL
ncbi:hypothetical protein AI27_12670 [Sphingomonas sp. BHC-A]|nr:hypothetical protein AI27_12670 [Sphingomonas sp. BHC-A]